MLDHYGPFGVGSLHLAVYMAELARAYQVTPGEWPIWLQ
jgi:hypothetical protein